MAPDINEIRNMDLFRGIKEEDLGGMLTCLGARTRTFSKGEFISIESDEVRWVCIILSGTVHMIKHDVWGNETILSVSGEGQLFGETFAGSDDPVSSVSFYAARPSKVLSIPFHRIMHTCDMSCVFHHRIIENMVSLIAGKNRQLMEKLEIVSQKTLRKKILSYLSLQSQQHGSSSFTIPLGRSELANYLNADRSALTRELSAMEDEGLISFSRNTFTLLI